MYLKNLELVGFKSFANRTKLEFGPGMTAVVGPNGCGKSNVSDAIRWVLGEQSARLLRGSKMEDCIFNGTDKRKSLGMAEVSITLAQCEDALGTEFNEITVTRRVFKSGEGQYFINKAPCRLKDIQRLFMGTGIGTNSYSLMEQGKIDQILSSKPEDRRAVFEEASGITKYKADKKEAIRKLEHTEANLQRLADIIKEVKRQIISLQRQAGKAKRYQKLREDLRKLDIFSSRRQLADIDNEINTLNSDITRLDENIAGMQTDIETSEQKYASLREKLSETEADVSAIRQASAELKAELSRIAESARVNKERINELELLLERDSGDAEKSRAELESCKAALASNTEILNTAGAELAVAEQELANENSKLNLCDEKIEELNRNTSALHEESVEKNSAIARLKNELADIEHEERAAVFQRERLEAEKTNLEHVCTSHNQNLDKMTKLLELCREESGKAENQFKNIEGRLSAVRLKNQEENTERNNIERRIAERNAKIELLTQNTASGSGFSAGAGKILDTSNPLEINKTAVLGALADLLHSEPDYRTAVEAVLRSWLDALVVADFPNALDILKKVNDSKAGAVRLIPLATGTASSQALPVPENAVALKNHVSCAEKNAEPLLERLFSNVFVIDSPASLPATPDAGASYVTKDGMLIHSNGAMELWAPDSTEKNPLARKHLLDGLREETDGLQKKADAITAKIENSSSEITSLEEELKKQNQIVDEQRKQLAVRESELQLAERETSQARERLETVLWELKNLDKDNESVEVKSRIASEIDALSERQTEIRALIAAKTDEIKALEQERKNTVPVVMAKQAVFTEKQQTTRNLKNQSEPLANRIAQLEAFVESRTGRFDGYRSDIESRKQAVAESERQIPETEKKIEENAELLLEANTRKEQTAREIEALEHALKEKRNTVEALREQRSGAGEKRAELRIRRQNTLDRVTNEYKISADAIQLESDPEWENGEQPDPETQETMVAELRARIESLGAVNLVAIEEYKEHEERFAFLSSQYEDLTQSRQQLHDMIRKINQTTSEMFSETFNKINDNFQTMFKNLFGGGNAKLMMIDDEDPLECGIEIIAKPPGKSLKSVSLLSGGERTLTAVALLFAIYMVKPSPFCVLDELDAALDESNIKRFVSILIGFIRQSQFIVITHSKQTITAADILYGITMEEKGVSSVVSMRFPDKTDEQTPPPETQEQKELAVAPE